MYGLDFGAGFGGFLELEYNSLIDILTKCPPSSLATGDWRRGACRAEKSDF